LSCSVNSKLFHLPRHLLGIFHFLWKSFKYRTVGRAVPPHFPVNKLQMASPCTSAPPTALYTDKHSTCRFYAAVYGLLDSLASASTECLPVHSFGQTRDFFLRGQAMMLGEESKMRQRTAKSIFFRFDHTRTSFSFSDCFISTSFLSHLAASRNYFQQCRI